MALYRRICDICYEDGELRIAVATYEGDGGQEFAACAKHFEIVKEAKSHYTELAEDDVLNY